eukprot:gene11327-4139_t
MSWTRNYSAMWQNTTIAKASKKKCVEFDGNIYFPIDSLDMEYFKESDKKTDGKWKGEASHFNVTVDGKENKNCCVFYKDPKPEAKEIKGYGKQKKNN